MSENDDGVYVLYKIIPYISSFPKTYVFINKDKVYSFIINEISTLLYEKQLSLSGLKGTIHNHTEKYKKYLLENDELYYYGEYIDYYDLEPYEIQYKIEYKSIIL